MSSSNQITVWGVGTTRTFRVHWMLHELGVDYLTERIESRTGETVTPEYSMVNPKQKIPAFAHNDFVLSESFAIMRYARNEFGGLPYDEFQTSSEGRARYDEWAAFIMMELDATSLYVVRRHQDLPAIYGEAPAAVASSIDYFTRMLDSVANNISAANPIWGSTFSELDILMTITLDWATTIGLTLPDSVLGYQKTMQRRVAYQAAIRHNFKDLKIDTRTQ